MASTPGDCHQPADLVAGQPDAAQFGVDEPQLLAMEVELAQQRLGRLALIDGQRLLGQPRAALLAEQVGGRAARNEVAVQDRVDAVLQARALADDVGPTVDLASQRVGLVVGQPHARQVVGGQQLGEHLGVDLVGLDLRLGDRPGLRRVGDHHARHPTLQQPRDRVRVAGRLQRHLIGRGQAVGKQPQRLWRRRDLTDLTDDAALPDGDLREFAMHVKP